MLSPAVATGTQLGLNIKLWAVARPIMHQLYRRGTPPADEDVILVSNFRVLFFQVEYMIVKLDREQRKAKLLLNAEQVLEELQRKEKEGHG